MSGIYSVCVCVCVCMESVKLDSMQLPPHKKGEEIMKASLNYVSFISPPAPDSEPKRSC